MRGELSDCVDFLCCAFDVMCCGCEMFVVCDFWTVPSIYIFFPVLSTPCGIKARALPSILIMHLSSATLSSCRVDARCNGPHVFVVGTCHCDLSLRLIAGRGTMGCDLTAARWYVKGSQYPGVFGVVIKRESFRGYQRADGVLESSWGTTCLVAGVCFVR